MDENAAVGAVRQAIADNSATFLSGLSQNGLSRSLDFLSETVLSNPAGYYAVKVHCRTPRQFIDPEAYNTANPTLLPYKTVYPIEILVGDYATPDLQNDGDYPFRTAHRNFRTFTDRICEFFFNGASGFTDPTTSKSFRLPRNERVEGRLEVTKENMNPMEVEGQPFLLIGATIRFAVIGCND